MPFTYYGAKYSSFGFINSKLPRTRQYIEPFGGSGMVLLNRDPVPIETYNDLNGDIPHFFRVLRDQPDELMDALEKTPYSREEHTRAKELRAKGYPDCDDVERARLWFVLIQQSRSADQHHNPHWSLSVNPGSGSVDRTTSYWWLRLNKHLPDVAGRLRDVQVENGDALDIIETHDSPDATFYVDPPYVSGSRGNPDAYVHEMTDDEHRGLFELLDECEGYVAVSGYDSGLYSELYDSWNVDYDEERAASPDGDGNRQEVLWTNYDVDELGGKNIGDWSDPSRKGQQLTLRDSIFD